MRAAVTLDVRILDAPDMTPEDFEAEIREVVSAALSERYPVTVDARVVATS